MFKTIRLKWRLTMLVLAALAGLILLRTLQIAHLRTQLLDDRKASLAMLIDVAGSTASEFQAAEVMEAALPEAERAAACCARSPTGRARHGSWCASWRHRPANRARPARRWPSRSKGSRTRSSMNATALAARSLLQTAGELDGAVSRFRI